jgi:hypothetical protein
MNEETLIIGGPHDGTRMSVPLEWRELRLAVYPVSHYEPTLNITAGCPLIAEASYEERRVDVADGTAHRVFVSPGTDPLASLIAGYRRPLSSGNPIHRQRIMKTDEPLPLACPDCGYNGILRPRDGHAICGCGRYFITEPTPDLPPAKPTEELPRHCPHCGAKTETPEGRFFGTYACGLGLGRESLKDQPVERFPCKAAKPAPETLSNLITKEWENKVLSVICDNSIESAESQEDARLMHEMKARASELAARMEEQSRLRDEILWKAANPLFIVNHTPPKQPSEQNTMTTAPNTPCEIQPLPTPGSDWVIEVEDERALECTVKASGPNGIYVKGKGCSLVYTPTQWNQTVRTQLPSKRDAIRIPRRGASRIKWAFIGGVACFFGKPFLPDLISAISGYVTRLM